MAKAKAPKINKFESAASRLAASFEHGTRPCGASFVKLKQGAPDWVREAVYAAHAATGERGPDDWVYGLCESAADMIEEYDNLEDALDATGEWADSSCDIYTSAAFQWAAAHACNRELCDEAAAEIWGLGTVWNSAQVEKFIQAGQQLGARRVAEVLLAAIVDQCR